jgi:hypothetical protein
MLSMSFVMQPAWGQQSGAAGGLSRDEAATIERVTVVGESGSETDPVGPNLQPEWTTRRRFSNADVYVQPPGQIELSSGWVVQEPNDEGETRHRFLQEIEIGLPHRLQFDLEFSEEINGGDGEFSDLGVEMRWAPADWGKLFMNPTLYGEWEFHPGEPDEFEIKLLFGESVASRVFAAVNLFYEREVGGEEEQEFAASTAWSYSLVDRVLGVGAEMRLTVEKSEDEYEPLFEIGPSLSWRIAENLALVAAPLFGVTEESPDVESFVFVRYYFGEDYDEESGRQTPSMEAR